MSVVAPERKQLSRHDLHAMAREGKSWEFLARAGHAATPDDALNLLISATFARLGLKTLARETAELLSPAVLSGPQGTNLTAAIAKLGDTIVPFQRREQTARTNLERLASRGINLSQAFDDWRANAACIETFAANDGGIVQRPQGERSIGQMHLITGPARAQEAIARAVNPDESMGPPLAIVGPRAPWLIRAAFDASRKSSLGYARRLTILESDPLRLIDALSLADLSDVLVDPRVEMLVGADCWDRFRSSLESRLEEQFEPTVLSLMDGSTGEGETHSVAAIQKTRSIVADTMRLQRDETARAVRATDTYYNARTPEYFRGRFDEALAGTGEPLRVLIPTCRFSSFVKHAAADLAAAFRRAGHEAQILIEERDDSRMAELAYRRALSTLKPDLVVVINYPRACMGNAFPKNVPFACWVQDAMPHLFNAEVGRAQGPLDFVIGHTHLELFQKFEYPIERAMSASVVANAEKFHPAPVAACSGVSSRFEAEIAIVTHHSESPEAMHARLCVEAAKAPKYVEAFHSLFGDIARAVENAGTFPLQNAVHTSVRARLREVFGHEPDARTETLILRQYAGPMADRMLRHQTIRWAADIAKRRHWRLNLHGRGWEKHTTLAPFARPEIAHGEDLRAVYQTAATSIHVAGSTLSHQRVFECFLSGGLCLSRMHREIVSSVKGGVQRALLCKQPDTIDDAKGLVGYRIADHPEAMTIASTLGSVGFPFESEFIWIRHARVESFRKWANAQGDDTDATFFLRDLAETTFGSPEQLERLVERAIEAGPWRSRVTEMVARRVRKHLTHDALARRVVGFLKDAIRVDSSEADELREAV